MNNKTKHMFFSDTELVGAALEHVEAALKCPRGKNLYELERACMLVAEHTEYIIKCVSARDGMLNVLRSLQLKTRLSVTDRDNINQAIANAEDM